MITSCNELLYVCIANAMYNVYHLFLYAYVRYNVHVYIIY